MNATPRNAANAPTPTARPDSAEPGGALPEAANEFLRALANETRQQILLLFVGGATLTVGDVARRLGAGASTASEHLALLRRGGLLRAHKDGKQVTHRVDPTAISQRLAGLEAFLLHCFPPPGRQDGAGGPA